MIGFLLPENNDYLFIIFGDFFHFISKDNTLRIGAVLAFVLAIILQLIYYYNYKNDIKPTFLKVFEMMSGLVSPKSIGLTNKEKIYRFIKISRISFFICKYLLIPFIPIIVFIFSIINIH